MIMDMKSPKMPNLGAIVDTSKYRDSVFPDLCLQFSLGESLPEKDKQFFASHILESAHHIGVKAGIQEAGDSMSTEGQLVLEVYGRLDLMNLLYSRIPHTITASDISHKILGLGMHRPYLELSFFISRQEAWIEPVYISAAWLKSSKLPSLYQESVADHMLAVDYSQPVRHLGNSQIKLFCESRKEYPITSKKNENSVTYKNMVRSKRKTPEWKKDLNKKNFNHSSNNIRFNGKRESPEHPAGNQFQADIALTYQISQPAKSMPGEMISQADFTMIERTFDLDPSQGRHIARVEGIDWRVASPKDLSNLFTNYGNVDRAIIFPKRGEMCFCYVSQLGVQNALGHLHGLPIGNGLLSISAVSKRDVVQLASQNEYSFYLPRKRFSSKGTGLPNWVNPVSRTLHITFHHDCEDLILADQELFVALSQHCKPIRIKRESNKKKKNMWFVEFMSDLDGVTVVMKQHNQPFEGGTLRISFTKTL